MVEPVRKPDISDSAEPAEVVDFNDPNAWGFCRYCAFQVATLLEPPHKMLAHDRLTGYGGKESCRCHGSLLEPTVQSGPDVAPASDDKIIPVDTNDDDPPEVMGCAQD
ncbi:hypothetical protein ACFWPU_00655 [Streptomyces sp. NPDC058471]|uniref:hypothetical protein n=1 Tax=Streptomyces sp. NPDC058471 TaxID=3346516 RepID=UPI003649F428